MLTGAGALFNQRENIFVGVASVHPVKVAILPHLTVLFWRNKHCVHGTSKPEFRPP